MIFIMYTARFRVFVWCIPEMRIVRVRENGMDGPTQAADIVYF